MTTYTQYGHDSAAGRISGCQHVAWSFGRQAVLSSLCLPHKNNTSLVQALLLDLFLETCSSRDKGGCRGSRSFVYQNITKDAKKARAEVVIQSPRGHIKCNSQKHGEETVCPVSKGETKVCVCHSLASGRHARRGKETVSTGR